MGTHGKLAITLADGTHDCVERTLDGADVVAALQDWEDSEGSSKGVWTPMEPLQEGERDAILTSWGHGLVERGHEDQEQQFVYYVHVDFSRRTVGINGAVWGMGGGDIRLGRNWTLTHEDSCPGVATAN